MNPFVNFTRWDTVAANLNEALGRNFSVRGVRDRCDLLLGLFKRDDRTNLRNSPILTIANCRLFAGGSAGGAPPWNFCAPPECVELLERLEASQGVPTSLDLVLGPARPTAAVVDGVPTLVLIQDVLLPGDLLAQALTPVLHETFADASSTGLGICIPEGNLAIITRIPRTIF
ncbi:hypothetical protein HPB47_005447 [Ixodes persulcatus]|uniref:Uncharacterized protein n=1 Tax=Ixodes persulcatus TaxID=34615 RepID=A0AC60PE92_IXOPE|nr:hypothetical protein HPB47_005447 [Ixodes persulcatus]